MTSSLKSQILLALYEPRVRKIINTRGALKNGIEA
jgi:hypothetical protein